jgi:uncharacterized damage-inducible protein DinB
MNVQDIRTFFEFHYWATDKLLQECARLTPAQLDAPVAFPSGSLRATLVHVLGAEWVWRSRWQGVSPPGPLDLAELPTFASIVVRWAAERNAMAAYLAQLGDDALSQPLVYRRYGGHEQSQPLWQLIMQVLFHSVQHRTEIAAMLTDFGYSPGDIDFIIFAREQGL